MSIEPFVPITREKAASILSISLTTLDALIESGALPAPRALGSQRRLYWHPAVFYAHLHRALTGEESGGTPTSVSAATPMASTLIVARTAVAAAPPHTREPIRARGTADIRARQAARIEKLNQ